MISRKWQRKWQGMRGNQERSWVVFTMDGLMNGWCRRDDDQEMG
jgi:hypothetical protein